jgi:molybdopterin/thiamine biosynthesis adenylyltransferase
VADLWWQRLPGRVLEEDSRLQALVTEGTIGSYAWSKQPNGEVWLTAELRLGNQTQSIELRFPERYPGECPSLRPLPYGRHLSEHQFGGEGVLCLELGPDNWHARYMAADLVQSAWKLLALETIKKDEPVSIPSRHVDTLGMSVRSTPFRLVVTPQLRAALEASGTSVAIKACYFIEDSALVYWVTQVPEGTPLDLLPPRIADGHRYPALAVHVGDDAPAPPTDVREFQAFLHDAGVPDDQVKTATGLVLLWTTRDVIARLVPKSADDPVRSLAVIPVSDLNEEPAGFAPVGPKTGIAIVGLGSLGSKVATSLVRSGGRTIVAVDGDVFLPENIARHDGDYSHVGLMKAEVTAARVRDVAGSPVTVLKFNHDVADATNPKLHSLTTDALRVADLIVDATASADAFNFLADLASDEQRPLVWGEIFGGGLGGYVAYAVPGVTPCPSCVRAAFLAQLDEWPPAPQGSGQRYGAVAADVPLIASDADVTVIAGALTTVALRVLARDFDGCSPITVLGLRRGWIFERSFETRLLSARMDDFSCPRCWTKPAAPDQELLTQVEKLLT